MRYFVLFICSFLCIVSCVETNVVYSKYQRNFANNRWLNDDLRVFEFNIDDDKLNYNIEFQFGHIYDYELSKIPIEVEILDPKGESETLNIDIIVKDELDKDIGECLGDICDVHQIFKHNVQLNRGSYVVKVQNKTQLPYLPNVLGIGLCVTTLE